MIVQKVREAERERQFEEYKDRIGEIVNGTVKRVEYGNVIVDLGRAEAIVRRDEAIPRENFRSGDRVRAYIYDVRREQRGPQIFLSRTHPEFMAKLFAQEVPEIYDGIVEIKSVARDPGSPRQDRRHLQAIPRSIRSAPASACAAAASRPWSTNCRARRSTSFRGRRIRRRSSSTRWQPAEVTKVVLDEDAERIEVVVPDEQLSLAIGRRGQNVRLASQLDRLGHRHPDRGRRIRAPPEGIRRAHRTVHRGAGCRRDGRPAAGVGRFRLIEEVAYVDADEIASIEGFDEGTATNFRPVRTNSSTSCGTRSQAQEAWSG